jgi:hypothetical protein
MKVHQNIIFVLHTPSPSSYKPEESTLMIS